MGVKTCPSTGYRDPLGTLRAFATDPQDRLASLFALCLLQHYYLRLLLSKGFLSAIANVYSRDYQLELQLLKL